MKHRLILLFAVYGGLLPHFSVAQQTETQSLTLAQNCACPIVLDEIIDKVSRIYAGFDDKVTAKTRPQYDQLLLWSRSQAKTAKTQATCLDVLKAYAGFFKDNHVFVFPRPLKSQRVTASVANKGRTDLVTFRPLDKEYLYIKLAVFNQQEVDRLDSMIRANSELLTQTPYLIFDLRGNGGGNADMSQDMIKLIYTNPMVFPAWDYRSSPELIESRINSLTTYQKDTVANAVYYQPIKKLVNDLQAKPGQLVRGGDDFVITMGTNLTANPQHIAFLIDKGCGSSTEYFVFAGKQSKKVTLFGQNTMGVMDYGEDQNYDLCDGLFNLAVPWGRNGWTRQYRIDNVGFAPDVRIPPTETDWVKFVQDYYRQTQKKR